MTTVAHKHNPDEGYHVRYAPKSSVDPATFKKMLKHGEIELSSGVFANLVTGLEDIQVKIRERR